MFKEFGVTNITVLHTTDRKVADSEAFVKPITTARAVWFPGGRQWRLADWSLHTRTQRGVERVLERGGVVGGSSAGASILASYMVRGARENDYIMMAPGYEEGFGLIKGVAINQHMLTRNRQDDLEEVVAKHPEVLGIGIDESTAIVVRGQQFEIAGASKVAIHDGRVVASERQQRNGKKYFYMAPSNWLRGARLCGRLAPSYCSLRSIRLQTYDDPPRRVTIRAITPTPRAASCVNDSGRKILQIVPIPKESHVAAIGSDTIHLRRRLEHASARTLRASQMGIQELVAHALPAHAHRAAQGCRDRAVSRPDARGAHAVHSTRARPAHRSRVQDRIASSKRLPFQPGEGLELRREVHGRRWHGRDRDVHARRRAVALVRQLADLGIVDPQDVGGHRHPRPAPRLIEVRQTHVLGDALRRGLRLHEHEREHDEIGVSRSTSRTCAASIARCASVAMRKRQPLRPLLSLVTTARAVPIEHSRYLWVAASPATKNPNAGH